jgi:hypothetical protein
MRDFSAPWAQFIVACLAFVVSVVALCVARQSAFTAKKTAQAKLVTLFLNEYACKKMMSSLLCLACWRDSNPDLLGKIAQLGTASKEDVELLINDAGIAISNDDLDESRRFADQYFYRAYKLWNHELLDDIALKSVLDNDAYHRGLFFDVVTPLTLAVGLVRTSKKDPIKFIEIQKENDDWRRKLRRFCPPQEAT